MQIFRIKNLFIILTVLLTNLAFADQSVIKTKYFDVIYDNVIYNSARILAENADSYAEQINKKLDKNIKELERMPVYLVAENQSLNGYYYSKAYKRIVIYVAPSAAGSLESLDNSVLRVFYHEFTHAMSIGLGAILYPASLKEGVAVSFESDNTQKAGRLHDPFVWHTLQQNKLDNANPGFTQSGSFRDVYPQGQWPYFYGAAFTQYLIDTYGLEKFQQFWKTSWRLFPKHKFYSVYQVKLNTAWDAFIKSIKLPKDVYFPKVVSQDLPKSGYAMTTANTKNLYYFDFDNASVYRYDAKAPELVVKTGNTNSIAVSDDDKYLLISNTNFKEHQTHSPIGKVQTKIYSLQNQTYTKEFDNIRSADFIDANRIAGIQVEPNATTNLVIVDIKTGKTEKLYSADFTKQYTTLYAPAYLGKNALAFIAANGLNRDILVININTKNVQKINLPSNVKFVRQLQSIPAPSAYKLLAFSWAEQNSMYRSAYLDLNAKQVLLQKDDFGGGAFYPVKFKNKFISVGKYSTYNSLNILERDKFTAKSTSLGTVAKQNADANVFKESAPKAQKYNAFTSPWFWKPSIGAAFKLPNDFGELGAYGLGVNLSTLDPTESLYANLKILIHPYPLFLGLDANLGYKFSGFDFKINGHEALNSYPSTRVRKTGLGFNLGYNQFLNSTSKTLSANYNLNTDWAHKVYDYPIKKPEGFFKNYAQGVWDAYNKDFTDTIITHSIGIKFIDLHIRSLAKRMFFAHDFYKTSVSAKIGHTYSLEDKNNAAYILTRLEHRTPIVPLRLGASGFVGYNSLLLASSGGVYYFGKDWLVDDKTSNFVKPVFGFRKTPKVKELLANKITGALGFDANLTIFDIEIQDTASFIPVLFNRFKIDVEYNGMLQLYKDAENKLTSNYLDSINAGIMFDLNGLELGAKFGTPLSKTPEFSFGLIMRSVY